MGARPGEAKAIDDPELRRRISKFLLSADPYDAR